MSESLSCILLIVGFLPSQCFAFALVLCQTFPGGINFWSVDISWLLVVWEPKCKLYKTKRKKRNTWSKKYRNTEEGIFWSVDICWRPAVWLQTASCARQRAPVQQPPFSQVLQQENTFSSFIICTWFSYGPTEKIRSEVTLMTLKGSSIVPFNYQILQTPIDGLT